MYLTTIVLCAINIIMPVIAAAIVAPRLQDNSSWKMGFFGGVICAVTSTVLYVNIGIIGYQGWNISIASIVIVFGISLIIGFGTGYASMWMVNYRLQKQEYHRD